MFRKLGEKPAINTRRRSERERRYASVADLLHPSAAPGKADNVNAYAPVATRPITNKKTTHLRVDALMLLIVFTLIIFGMVMLYSASYDYSLRWYENPSTIFTRQLLFLGVGCVSALFLTFFDYHWFHRLATVIMVGAVALLVAVLFTGETLNGATRTFSGGSIQPSELAKFAIVIYLAVWLFSKRDRLHMIGFGLIPLAIILGLVAGLILVQPDLSAAFTIFMLGGLMFFLGEGDSKQIVALLILVVLIVIFVVVINPTGSDRIKQFVGGLTDPRMASNHVQRSFEAFIRGGWFGVGIGNAETKLTGLPLAPYDSVFAVIGEETGVMGVIFVLGMFSLFLWRGMVIARHAPDHLGSLLAGGLTLWICLEAFLNLAGMVNLVPFTGNALPFFSAGGSHLTATLAAVGILLNISRLSVKSREDNERSFNAVVDLRRRDWRRSVSSSGRSARTAK
jgi:cell division protein FtsW